MPLRLLLTLLLLCASVLAGVAFTGGWPAPAPASAAHPEPGDRDGDSVRDERDNCPDTPNGAQIDTDRDGQGDSCDLDDDGDGIADAQPDNCRLVVNPLQENDDGDGYGNACPPVDTDADGVIDPDDNCDQTPNVDQKDFDGDDRGDPCDNDYDGDKFDNAFDNCPLVYNPTTDTVPPFRQPDADRNGKGTACDPDEGLPSSLPPGGGSGSGGATGQSSDPSRGTIPGPAVPRVPDGAVDGSAATSGSGPSPPKDTRKPTVRLRVARNHAAVSARDPFVVPVSCSEACSLEVSLVVDAKIARRLRLGSRPATLAKGSWALAGRGGTYVILDWQRRAGAVLRRARSLDARVVARATDPAGNATSASRAVTLRR